MRNPLGRCARRRLIEHSVDLLQREAFGLGDEEPSVNERGGAKNTPDIEDLSAEVGFVFVD